MNFAKSLSVFSQLVYYDAGIFPLQELKDFDLKTHKKFHKALLANHPILENAIKSHNTYLRALYNNISENLTIKEYLETFVEIMSRAGKTASAQEYALPHGKKRQIKYVIFIRLWH